MQAALRTLLEGRKSGWLSFALRAGLSPFGIAYGIIGKCRYLAYRSYWCSRHRAPLPVISVGNLTAGGTGKTPFVAMLCRLLKSMNKEPAVLMRGYAQRNPALADEVLLYQQILPGLKIYPHANRILSAQTARANGAKILVLDDGFQHLPMQRDLDILLIDATCPFGGGLPLPAGMLREFPSALTRADVIIITRADQVSNGQVNLLKEQIHAYNQDLPILTATHRPSRLSNLNGSPQPLDALSGKRVVALSGIGRPDTFAVTLRDLGAEVCASHEYSDHHHYHAKAMQNKLLSCDSTWIPVTTEKDAVKLQPILNDYWRERVMVVGVEMRVAGLPFLRERIERIINS